MTVCAVAQPGPAIPIEGQPGIFARSGRPPSVEIIGVDLAQGGAAVAGPAPTLRVGAPLDIDVHLRRIGAAPPGAQLRAIVRGPGYGPAPSFLKMVPLDGVRIEFGCAAKLPFTMDLYTRTFVGPGTLTISEVVGDEPADRWAVLCTVPVDVPAVSWRSQTGDAPYEKDFGAYYTRLFQSFRLAPGTSIAFPVPDTWTGPMGGIGVVSCYAYDTGIAQGEPVCRCDAVDALGKTLASGVIACGISTAVDVLDTLPERERRSGPIAVALSERIGPAEAGQQRAFYAGRVPLHCGAAPSRIVFTYLRDTGALDVDDVALLTDVVPRP